MKRDEQGLDIDDMSILPSASQDDWDGEVSCGFQNSKGGYRRAIGVWGWLACLAGGILGGVTGYLFGAFGGYGWTIWFSDSGDELTALVRAVLLFGPLFSVLGIALGAISGERMGRRVVDRP